MAISLHCMQEDVGYLNVYENLLSQSCDYYDKDTVATVGDISRQSVQPSTEPHCHRMDVILFPSGRREQQLCVIRRCARLVRLSKRKPDNMTSA